MNKTRLMNVWPTCWLVHLVVSTSVS